MSEDAQTLRRGFWSVSLATLASRGLGLARDVATAALFGLEGGVMDALVVAFRLPNLPRRVLGEGALATSLLPVFTAEHQRDSRRAWQLVSVLLVLLGIGMAALALVGELLIGGLLVGGLGAAADPATRQVLGLSAVLLPYMVLVCLAAQVSAVLQARLKFRTAALAPVLLNVCWLVMALGVPYFTADKTAQVYGIAGAVLVSGVLQLLVQLPELFRLGFRFDFQPRAAWPAVRQVFSGVVPVALALSVTQLNVVCDSLIAWGLAAEPGGSRTIAWLGHAVEYPLASGAAAAVYYGERFYQLPLGVLGVAVATVIYPLVARHAARGDRQRVGQELTRGLRLVWFLALPAGVGLTLVAEPAVRLFFEHGSFTADDTRRTATMIAGYAAGAWACCALPVVIRGFYALGDRQTPARVAMGSVGLNVALNLALVWPLAELGLAVSTVISAIVQLAVLLVVYSRGECPLGWRELRATFLRGSASTLLMALVVLSFLSFEPVTDANRWEQSLHLIIVIVFGVASYLSAAWLLRMEESAWLLASFATHRTPQGAKVTR